MVTGWNGHGMLVAAKDAWLEESLAKISEFRPTDFGKGFPLKQAFEGCPRFPG